MDCRVDRPLFNAKLHSRVFTKPSFDVALRNADDDTIIDAICNKIRLQLVNLEKGGRPLFATSIRYVVDDTYFPLSYNRLCNYLYDLYKNLFCNPEYKYCKFKDFKNFDKLKDSILLTLKSFMYDSVGSNLDAVIEKLSSYDNSAVDVEDLNTLKRKDVLNVIYDSNSFIDRLRLDEFTRQMFRIMIINTTGDTPGIVDSVEQMNRGIASYQQDQYNKIVKYLIEEGGYSSLRSTLMKLIYVGDHLTTNDIGILDVLLLMHNHIMQLKSEGRLIDALNYQQMSRNAGLKGRYLLLDAVNAYVNLKWFDTWAKESVGEILSVNEGMSALAYAKEQVGGVVKYNWKYNIDFNNTKNISPLWNSPFMDAIVQQKSFSKMVISSIDLYNHRSKERMVGGITPQQFVQAFCMLLDAAMHISFAHPYLMEFFSAICELQSSPHTALKKVFEALFRRDNLDLLHDLYRNGIDDAELDTLYSVYRAMYGHSDETKRVSFETLEAEYLAKNGCLSRYNIIDTLLGVIRSSVKNTYLSSVTGQYNTTTSMLERYPYTRNKFGFINTINNFVANNKSGWHDIVTKYAMRRGADLGFDGNTYVINIGDKLSLLITLSNATSRLLQKHTTTPHKFLILYDGEVGNLPDVDLSVRVRQKILNNDESLTTDLRIFRSLLQFADDVLGTNFLTEEGLNEYALADFFDTKRKRTTLDELMSVASIGLMNTRIYDSMTQATMPDGSKYRKSLLKAFLSSADCPMPYLSKIDRTMQNNYFFMQTEGPLLRTVANDQTFMTYLGKARSVLQGDTESGITYSMAHTSLPNFSPFYLISHVKLLIHNTPEGSAMAENFFYKEKNEQQIGTVCTSLEVLALDGTQKSVTLLTFGEALYNQIVNQWMVPMMASGDVYALPHCYSDKSRIAVVQVHFRNLFGFSETNYASEMINPLFNVNKSGHNFKDYILDQFFNSVAATYKKTWNNIVQQYEKIYPHLREVSDADKASTLLSWLKTLTEDSLRSLVNEYNINADRNGLEHLLFTKEMHYRVYGDHLSLNEILYENTHRRYQTVESLRRTMKDVTREYIKELLDQNVEFKINLSKTDKGDIILASVGKQNAITLLFAKSGLSVNDWVRGNKMVLARDGDIKIESSSQMDKEGITFNPIIEAFVLSDTLLSHNLNNAVSGLDINVEIAAPDLSDIAKSHIGNIQKWLGNKSITKDNLTLVDVAMAIDKAKAAGVDAELIKSVQTLYDKAFLKVEDSALTQLSKRNMASTATMRQELTNAINGAPEVLNMAVVDDRMAKVWGFASSKSEEMKPADGQIYLDGVTALILSMGLLDQRTGSVSKPLVIFRDFNTCTMGLVKCGAMTLDNEHCRLSIGGMDVSRWVKKMLNWRWNGEVDLMGRSTLLATADDPNGVPLDFKKNILLDILLFYQDRSGESGILRHVEIIDFGREDIGEGDNHRYVYYTVERQCDANGNDFVKGSPRLLRVYHIFDGDSKHRRIKDTYIYEPGVPKEGADTMERYRNAKLIYDAKRQKLVDYLRKTIKDTDHTIDSLYELYKAFGGEWCEELSKDGILLFSENNYKPIANYVIHVTDETGKQVLKDKQIHILAELSAVKRGAANVNHVSSLTDDTPFLHMKIESLFYGKVLDSDEDIDAAKVTEMSLMISWLGSAGYAVEDVRDIYQALGNIANNMSHALLTAFDLWVRTGDRSAILDFMQRAVTLYIQARKGSDLASQHAKYIELHMNTNANHDDDPVKMAFSDPTIFPLVINIFASIINKNSLLRRYEGMGHVIITSKGINMLYEIGDRPYRFDDILRMALAEDPKITRPLSNETDITIYNKALVLNYLAYRQERLPFFNNTERFAPSDNVRIVLFLDINEQNFENSVRLKDAEGKDITAIISLDDLETYWLFKDKPLLALLDSGKINIADQLRVIECFLKGNVRYQKAITVPRDLKPKLIEWEYEDELGQRHYCNIFDDYRYRVKNTLADRATLFDELLNTKIYKPDPDKPGFRVLSIRNEEMEAMVPNIYRSKINTGNLSLSLIHDSGKSTLFINNLPLIDHDKYDVAFMRMDGLHEYLSFNVPSKERALSIGRITKVAVLNDPNIITRVYACDEYGNLLYEIGREIRRNDIEYVYDESVKAKRFVTKLGKKAVKNQRLYRNLGNGKVAKLELFVLLSLVLKNQRNILIHHISPSVLEKVKMEGELTNETISTIMADLYGTNLFAGMRFNDKLLGSSWDILKSTVKGLAQRLSYDKYLSYYLSESVYDILDKATRPTAENPYFLLDAEWSAEALAEYREALSYALYASFGMSLYFSTARIPGQGALSTRPVKAVAFFTEGANQVAISHFNLWLEGSDCDNDHEWFMGYSFDGNGRFVGWSNMFDYTSFDALKESLLLPMPSNRNYVAVDALAEDVTTINPNLLSRITFKLGPYGELTLSGLRAFAELARQYSRDKKIEKIYAPDDHTRAVVRLLREHEATLLPVQLREMAQKNYVNAWILHVSHDIRNCLESYMPTGMDTIKKLGDAVQSSRNMLNPAFKIYLQRLNLSAKGTVGIMANGMSGTFAWIFGLNDALAHNPSNFKKYGLYSLTLKGVVGRSKNIRLLYTINTLPDINVKASNDPEISSANQLKPSMPVLASLSEYTTGSTDNAKNPVLYKINATHDFAGMHQLLISLGVSIEDTVAFMTSPVARFIADISKGDIFAGLKIEINDAIDIIDGDYSSIVKYYAPKNSALRKRLINEGVLKEFNAGNVSKTELKVVPGTEMFDDYHNLVDTINMIKDKRSRLKDLSAKELEDDIDDFRTIYAAASEHSSLSIIYGTKRGLNTEYAKLDNQLRNIKNVYDNRVLARIKEIKRENEKIKKWNKEHPKNEKPLIAELTEEQKEKFSIADFLSDKDGYRQKIIDKYNDIKAVMNVFELLNNHPLFNSVFKLLYLENGVVKNISARARIYYDLIEKIGNDYGQITEKAQNLLFEGADSVFMMGFLRLMLLEFPYAEGYTLISKGLLDDPRETKGYFKLDTPEGIASFKRVMEEHVIPALKSGHYFDGKQDQTNTSFLFNTLINQLINDTSNERPIIRTGINMYTMKDKVGTSSIFEDMRSGLQELSTIYINGSSTGDRAISIADWLTLYNLVVNNTRSGRDRMSAVFADFAAKEGSMLFEYNKYIGNLDYAKGVPDYSPIDVLMAAAPIVNTTFGLTAPMVWLKTDSGLLLWRRNKNKRYTLSDIKLLTSDNDYRQASTLYANYFFTAGLYQLNIENVLNTLNTVSWNKQLALSVLADLTREGTIHVEKNKDSDDKWTLHIYIGANEQPYKVTTDAATNPLIDMVELLSSNETARDSVISGIKDVLLNGPLTRNARESSESAISGWNYMIRPVGESLIDGSYTLPDLRQLHPELRIPDWLFANVRLVASFKSNGMDIYLQVISSDGIEFSVCRDNINDLRGLISYYIVRKKISESPDVINTESLMFKDLAAVYRANALNKDIEVTPSKIQEMILHYLNHRQEFQRVYVGEGSKRRSATDIMDRIMIHIRELAGRVQYDDPFVADINSKLKYSENYEDKLPIGDVYRSLKNLHPEILKEFNINTEQEFVKAFKDKAFVAKFDEALSVEPEFWWRFSSLGGDEIIFKSHVRTIGDRYEGIIARDTIKEHRIVESYRGIDIYEVMGNDGVKRYFGANYQINDTDIARGSTDIAVIRRLRDNQLRKEALRTSSFYEFLFRPADSTELPTYLVESHTKIDSKKTISVLDIPLNSKTRFSNNEDRFLINNHTISDFHNMIRQWRDSRFIDEGTAEELIKKLDSPDRAISFLYLLNDELKGGRQGKDNEMLDIADRVYEAGRKYYYIDTAREGYGAEAPYRYNVIPTDPTLIREVYDNPRAPIMRLMDAVIRSINERLERNGNMPLDIECVTARDVEERTKEGGDLYGIASDSDKAFIYNGKIFINTSIARSTDFLHEYIHIFLGVLKSNPETRATYELLMYSFAASKSGRNEINRLAERYNNLPEPDRIEEALANRFSWYIYDLLSRTEANELSPLFMRLERLVVSASGMIFDKTYQGDIKTFFLGPIEDAFVRFNNQIAKFLDSSNSLGFLQTADTRKIVKWLERKIYKDGKRPKTDEKLIKEICK